MKNTKPGNDRLAAAAKMEGGCQSSLGTKGQGVTGTVESKLAVKALS